MIRIRANARRYGCEIYLSGECPTSVLFVCAPIVDRKRASARSRCDLFFPNSFKHHSSQLRMKGTLATLFFLTVGAVALSDTPLGKELVESNKLRRVLTRSKLIEGGNLLQSWAYATPERNRGFGGTGMFWVYLICV